MPQVDPLILQLRAETRQLRNELRSTTVLVQNQLNEQTRSVLRLEDTVNRSTNRIGGAFGSMGQRINGILGGLALGALVRELANLADEAKQLDAQLRLATNGFGTFAQGQEDVRRISEQTRGSLEATTKLYAGFLRASQETGRSQADAARATQTFAQALKIGGAGTEEAASATLQFNQALQSGVLRGDEFNSIMEASPRIARLLADALGVPIGQLRAMAEQGQITSDVLFRALTDRKYTAGIDAEFKQIPVTFGDAMQAIENSAVTSFGEFDKGGRFSDALVSFLTTGTNTFDGLTSRAEQFGIDTRAVFDGLANVFDPLEANGNAVFDALGIRIFGVSDQIKSLLGSIDQVYNFYADANNFGTRIENAFIRGLNRAQRRAGGGAEGDVAERSLLQRADSQQRYSQAERRSAARGRLDASVRRLEAQGFIVPRNADGTVNEAGIVRRPTVSRPAYSPAPSAGSSPTRRGRAAPRGRSIARDELTADEIAAALRKSINSSDSDKIVSDAERLEEAARNFRDVIGEVSDDFRSGVDARDENFAKRERLAELDEEMKRDRIQSQSGEIYALAGVLEDAFTLSSDQFWENFKRNGIRTLAFLAAQALVTSFSKGGGGLGSLLGNLGKGIAPGDGANGLDAIIGGLFGSLPRFASGGSMTIGGNAGIDRNMLSLNGQPIARVSRGETLAVSPNTRAARGNGGLTVQQTIHVDGRNSVTPAGFADEILRKANGYANEAAAASGREAVKAAPGAVQRARRFGTV